MSTDTQRDGFITGGGRVTKLEVERGGRIKVTTEGGVEFAVDRVNAPPLGAFVSIKAFWHVAK